MIRAKKEMGRLHAVHKSIAVGKLGKHLSAPAWAILYHAGAWSTWDGCEYRSGIRSIATALALDPRQVKRGLCELVALGIFTPKDRSPTASKREATIYIVSVPRRFDDGRLQLITGEVAPAKHAGRTARNAKNPNGATLLKVMLNCSSGAVSSYGTRWKVKNKTKSVAVLVSESKAAKAALLKQKQEQNVERVRVEQAKREQERIEAERIEQAKQAQYKQEREQREKTKVEAQNKIDEYERLEQERQKQWREKQNKSHPNRIEFPNPNESKGAA